MSDEFQHFVATLIIYAGVIVSFLGMIYGQPVMGIFLIVFVFMAVFITRAWIDL
jgi:hypothetical protein